MNENSSVQEIDLKEIDLLEIIGRGTFATVRKGKWKNIDVAVKVIEIMDGENSFKVEVNQMSRFNHANIIKVFGVCTKKPACLIMEYAEGGSLNSVLHCMRQVEYTAAHALSWLLQTANGVAYLHNMKPGPLIHRDLKPLNLLLINGGTVLKICDFGTVTVFNSTMSCNRGTAPYMAPEVFEGSQYSEKCDVFSWGIILWEVLTREYPYDDVGSSPFTILWNVYNGKRPYLIQNCPKILENLMTRCWDKNAEVRPSMSTIQSELSSLLRFMKGADVPCCTRNAT